MEDSTMNLIWLINDLLLIVLALVSLDVITSAAVMNNITIISTVGLAGGVYSRYYHYNDAKL
ncbi:hypothetical protein BDK61_2861 [Haloarcula quadrata]|uniref:Uncharacterized protein n=1 Tax=Haloarcula quadrata TaxID=182779 RepID=A0A495R8N9_9EURY|nr:hypothetical protein [Haloarcula quadrata]RKS83476.1 hypothetical protein BDK61_2861 [Haloarcula quadrata]